jgi:hypothetical protein
VCNYPTHGTLSTCVSFILRGLIEIKFFLYNMVAPPCGPKRWRSALVNLAPSVHRTFYLYQLIKEKFILSLSLRLMQFSSFSCLPLTLTPMWSLILLPCLRLELSCWVVSPPKTHPS